MHRVSLASSLMVIASCDYFSRKQVRVSPLHRVAYNCSFSLVTDFIKTYTDWFEKLGPYEMAFELRESLKNLPLVVLEFKLSRKNLAFGVHL